MRFLADSVWVGLGAAVGASLRHWIGAWWAGRAGSAFPWHTLAINVTGSLALGVFLALALTHGWSNGWRLFVAVGVCGGYTTFSSYSAEVVRLFEDRQTALAAGYILGSNALSIAACLAGAQLARLFWPPTS